jgi:2-polyprenyl-3-methyl-5-hydroxy-6-metoxy-1,4-benzoquinol methylase
MSLQEAFWTMYFDDVSRRGNSWLDYSNEHVQAQTFGLALEAAGSVLHKRCVDYGCGHGQFCRALHSLGAGSVTGVDIVPDVIAHHKREYPNIRWVCASAGSPEPAGLEPYDLAFLLEVLQYLPLEQTIDSVWDRLLPRGRIVAVVPNAACDIVSRTKERFDARYDPPTFAQLQAVLSGRPDLEHAAFRGMYFGTNQRIVPYQVSPWHTSEWQGTPNRVQFVAVKRGEGGV